MLKGATTMKSKIIIIVVAAVCITGASFATGVAIDRHNRETSILASEATSNAVSDALNSTITTQTITITEAEETSEPAATAAQTTTEASTTKAKKNSTITEQKTEKVITGDRRVITTANTTTNFTPSDGEGKRIKSPDGDYWKAKSYLIDYEYYAAEFPDIEAVKNHPVYVTEKGKLFYFDDNGNRIYEKDWKH